MWRTGLDKFDLRELNTALKSKAAIYQAGVEYLVKWSEEEILSDYNSSPSYVINKLDNLKMLNTYSIL